jgi:hypothetical protein
MIQRSKNQEPNKFQIKNPNWKFTSICVQRFSRKTGRKFTKVSLNSSFLVYLVLGPDKKYDLEERTALFAERVRNFCLKLPNNPANDEYIPQLLRSGASPGATTLKPTRQSETKISK